MLPYPGHRLKRNALHLSRTFARYVASLDYESLPPKVVDKVKALLLHALVMSIVGASTRRGQATVALIKKMEGKLDGMTLLVDGSRVTCAGAAFANSMLIRATGQKDSYRMLVHPGPCVIPAALAMAELCGKSGGEFITALAAGYEVETRIGRDFIPSTQARGFRSTAVYGTLGAAVAAGKVMGLSEDQLVAAIALACTFTGGTSEGHRSGGKEGMFHEPMAARHGIMAALLACENVRGSETALEGEAGFYHAFVGNNRGELSYVFTGPKQTSLDAIVADLGSRWELMHVIQKIYPTAGYNCPVIELMAQLRSKYRIAPGDIEEITVDMNWLETLYPSPAFPQSVRGTPGIGSTHYYVAYTCIHGSYPPLMPRLDPGEKSSGEDPRVMDLLGRVQVMGYHDRPPFSPRIIIRMRDGTTYQDEFRGNELEWDLDTEIRQIRKLFDDLPWGREKLEGIVQAIRRLEEARDVESLIQSCVRK